MELRVHIVLVSEEGADVAFNIYDVESVRYCPNQIEINGWNTARVEWDEEDSNIKDDINNYTCIHSNTPHRYVFRMDIVRSINIYNK